MQFVLMSVDQIQREVGKLPENERRRFAAWLLANYPPRSVDDLVSRAETDAKLGKWVPQPPTPDNIPSGKALTQAVERAKALGLDR